MNVNNSKEVLFDPTELFICDETDEHERMSEQLLSDEQSSLSSSSKPAACFLNITERCAAQQPVQSPPSGTNIKGHIGGTSAPRSCQPELSDVEMWKLFLHVSLKGALWRDE
ncbi:hypothetical protein FQA47_022539 [Oryzias melastigma]|uniref:Uncharacterized protein n=1 Tax=Oryzias melastigma TaxID=30732 RepID=A0A834CEG9_ORYME|nr:hypothetical protein FQA47_022539 [Oryzias melastigma]